MCSTKSSNKLRCLQIFSLLGIKFTALKVSVFGVYLVRIFQHSNWIRRDAKYLSLFSPNAGKYGPETPNTDTFHPVVVKRDASEIGCCVLPKEYNFLGLFWRISNFHWCVYWNTLIKSSLSVSVWQKDVVPLSLWGYLILQVLYLI